MKQKFPLFCLALGLSSLPVSALTQQFHFQNKEDFTIPQFRKTLPDTIAQAVLPTSEQGEESPADDLENFQINTEITITIQDSDNGVSTVTPLENGTHLITFEPEPSFGVASVLALSASGGSVPLERDLQNGTYILPKLNESVTIVVKYKTFYSVSHKEPEDGSLFILQNSPCAGDRVAVFFRPDEGFTVDEILVKDEANEEIPVAFDPVESCFAFIQPESAVEVEITYKKSPETTYQPTMVNNPEGECTLVNQNPHENELVALEILPKTGYSLQRVVVTDSQGNNVRTWFNEAGQPEFRQPDSAVTIETFYTFVLDSLENFTDISQKDWYTPYVAYGVGQGLMNGTKPNLFEPEESATRAMVAVALATASGEYIPQVTDKIFHDVEPGQWYSDAVAWCKDRGIVTGHVDGTFCADDPVSLEQLMTIFYSFAEYTHLDMNIYALERMAVYLDSPTISNYAIEPYQWALGLNYIQPQGRELRPWDHATRAEFAQILCLFLENNSNLTRLELTSFTRMAQVFAQVAVDGLK